MTQQTFEKRVHALKSELVQTIRNRSKQQKDLWQKVPYLALQADGRSGYSDNLARAYHHGYWPLEVSIQSGHYTVCVDLETGELLSGYDRGELARDEDVLRLALHPRELDAQNVLAELEAGAKEPIHPIYKSEDRARREQRIVAILKRGNIKKNTFVRR